MGADRATPPVEAEQDESAVSRAELHIEREKIQIERERLALERERLSAERERWKTDSDLQSRAEGRGIAVSTLVFVAVICMLVGVIGGFFSVNARASRSGAVGLEALSAGTSTNAAAGAGKPLFLRPVETGSGGRAYLLIVD